MSKYYQCRNQNHVTNIAAAIEDYYGSSAILAISGTNYVVFQVAGLSERVIMIQGPYIYYGTSWSSGSTISDPMQVANLYNVGTTVDLVLGDNSLLFDMTSSYRHIFSLGKLSNGDSVAFGWNSASSSSSYSYSRPYNMTTGNRISVMTLQQPFMSADGKVYKAPLYFVDRITHKLITNTDGSPASIPNIWSLSYPLADSPQIGAKYMITHASQDQAYFYGTSDYRSRLYTPLYTEFTDVAAGWEYRQ